MSASVMSSHVYPADGWSYCLDCGARLMANGPCSCSGSAPAQSPKQTQVGGDHYKSMAIQPVEFITKNNIPYCEANIIKYAARHKSKGGAQDVRKIIHYAQLILELQYGEKP